MTSNPGSCFDIGFGVEICQSLENSVQSAFYRSVQTKCMQSTFYLTPSCRLPKWQCFITKHGQVVAKINSKNSMKMVRYTVAPDSLGTPQAFPIDSYSKQVVQNWVLSNKVHQIIKNVMLSRYKIQRFILTRRIQHITLAPGYFVWGLELKLCLLWRTTASGQHPLSLEMGPKVEKVCVMGAGVHKLFQLMDPSLTIKGADLTQ